MKTFIFEEFKDSEVINELDGYVIFFGTLATIYLGARWLSNRIDNNRLKKALSKLDVESYRTNDYIKGHLWGTIEDDPELNFDTDTLEKKYHAIAIEYEALRKLVSEGRGPEGLSKLATSKANRELKTNYFNMMLGLSKYWNDYIVKSFLLENRRDITG